MHPLYFDAHRRFLRNRSIQFDKAAAKYPEPLNPDNWTVNQLADHAAQEMVDLLHYMEALRVKAETAADKPSELLEWIFDTLGTYSPDMVEETIMDIRMKINELFNGNLLPKGGE